MNKTRIRNTNRDFFILRFYVTEDNNPEIYREYTSLVEHEKYTTKAAVKCIKNRMLMAYSKRS